MRSRTKLLAALTAITLLTVLFAYDRAAAQAQLHYVPDVPSEFSYLYQVGIPNGSIPGIWAALPYDSITLERSLCMVACPTYKVTLYRGSNDQWGRAELKASVPVSASRNVAKFPEKSGDYVGTVDIVSYGRLNYLLVQLKFAKLSSSYTAKRSDARTVTVTATAASVTKQVSDDGGVGPIELWGIQQAIDSIAQNVNWSPK